jgi:hypothetical protein
MSKFKFNLGQQVTNVVKNYNASIMTLLNSADDDSPRYNLFCNIEDSGSFHADFISETNLVAVPDYQYPTTDLFRYTFQDPVNDPKFKWESCEFKFKLGDQVQTTNDLIFKGIVSVVALHYTGDINYGIKPTNKGGKVYWFKEKNLKLIRSA